MKTIILTLVAMSVVFSINAGEVKSSYYINNTGETMNCKKIQFRSNSIRVVLENGEKALIDKDNIKAIRVKGDYFEKLPVYIENKNTGKEEFMQFVTTRGGLKLYRYKVNISDYNGLKSFNLKGSVAECYVVFKGDQFHVAVTDANYPTLFSFFGLPYSEK
jgi:hypothetical protein